VIRIVTQHGGETTRKDRAVLKKIAPVYRSLLAELGIRRNISLLVCDEWTWLTRLKMHRNSIGHYSKGRVGGKSGEIVWLRRSYIDFYWPSVERVTAILKHELVHAKLKGKEEKSKRQHGKLFRDTAAKYGVPRDYR
jgi:hypothetical protein